MKLNVKKFKTLLIDGPASVSLLSGSVTVLGGNLKVGSKVVVRSGKRMPFQVVRGAKFELTLGEASSFTEVNGSGVPESWKDAVNQVLTSKRFASVLVIGGVDSGKTSFCTYLANQALQKRWKVAIIDGDLGQSDIGPPATVGLAHLGEPIVDLFGVQAESIAFVGATTPSKAFEATLDALNILKRKSSAMDIDFLIVNTDGWVEGEEAANYKCRVVELFAPNMIVVIQKGDELTPLLDALQGSRTFIVETPENIRKRSHETRKALREFSYRKYLRDAKIQSYPMSWVEIRGASIQTALPLNEVDNASKLDGESDVVVGLEDEKGELLGIGILCSIDLERRTMKVYTPVSQKARIIHVGQLKLDRNGKEIG